MTDTSPTQYHPHPRNEEYQFLELTIPVDHPHVTRVALHRPDKRNALCAPMWREIGAVFQTLGDGDGCRCILLTSSSSTFCAGIDVTDPSFLMPTTKDVTHTGLTFLPKLREMQACFTALERCVVPVVAAIYGVCIGAGVDLICAADVRLCHENSMFGVREVALGLAADVGTLQRLPEIAGNESLVRELCLTGRDFNAHQALELGLVSRIIDSSAGITPGEAVIREALQVCAQICQHSPVAVRGTKRALVFARDYSVAEGLDQIAAYNALALQSPELVQAWTARATKKQVTFADMPARSRL